MIPLHAKIFMLSFLLRIGILLYGEWQDKNMEVKFTDIDYSVFTDGAKYILQGESPYKRATYRYTPILAALLTPNIYWFNAFGKVMFCTFDIIAAYLMLKISNSNISNSLICFWLFNPMIFTISARGNAESMVCTFVLLSILLVKRQKILAASIVYGFTVHLKIYSLLYSVPLYFYLDKGSGLWPNVFTKKRMQFAFMSFFFFMTINFMLYSRYGFEFIYETFLYHVVRKDHRHNFSVYFYHIYLTFFEKDSLITSILTFLPQFVLTAIVGMKYSPDPVFACFVQTFVFVMFNKVCTSQSILWKAENEADRQPNDPNIQANYYKLLLEDSPDRLIERFERNRFATNDECQQYYVNALIKSGRVDKINRMIKIDEPVFKSLEDVNSSKPYSSTFPEYLTVRIDDTTIKKIKKNMKSKSDFISTAIFTLLMGILILKELQFETKNSPLSAKSILGINESPVRKEKSDKTFNDIKGLDEVVQEVQEIVHFLQNPKKFRKLNAKLPRGVLFAGPPGTGKTLLAKAISGEAGVPFFVLSGSECDEMFVGVGMRRIKELFENARKESPCIIFIDEIDAIGSKRNPRDPAWSRQCLNQLLTEMDGFSDNEGIIVIGATNLPESLDEAIMRPGRFDRKVHISLPDVKGRQDIFNLYLSKTKISPNVNVSDLAKATSGFSGADISGLVNTAAINATLENSDFIEMKHLEQAKDDQVMGRAKKNMIITEEVKKITAYHEGGHALIAILSNSTNKLQKATIIPRGQSLGHVSRLPDDELYVTKESLLADIDVSLAGRCAEELIFGSEKVTPGAQSDFHQASRIARKMVTNYGMGELSGNIFYNNEDEISDPTKNIIDMEIRKIIDESKKRTKALLLKHRADLDRLANELIVRETLSYDDIMNLLYKK
ncbi:Peptidase M41 domain-containing protein [Rozella allomycis CSF55]|uniref:Peptidase M41 domain-containing protein n=1 Tax=Rozella allomycis (strain CSF55) TaxID=988480 RepID=A0A075AVL6_ROZAC|nr:Peptidase M41 domain-containing protein [Rozella allomycis CSF55]|eukprot:EPZ34368.1 Peptidase M41 domain-containing protein [Rozella allomycis CSF55]